MEGWLRRFGGDRGGAAAVLMALCFMALMGAVGIAVDLGHVYMCSRQLQGAADLAAMAAAATMADASGPAADAAQASAQSTAALNLWSGAQTSARTQVGTYVPDPSLPATARFSAAGGDSASPNAVQVTLTAHAPLYFIGLLTGASSTTVSRTATAAQTRLAAFSVGSSAASLNGGIANAVMSAMTGSQVSLTALDYQALASAQVSLFDYLPALQTRVGVKAVSFNQLLAAQTAPSAQLAALADALTAEGQPAAATATRALSVSAGSLSSDTLSALFDLGPYGAQDHAQANSGTTVSVQALSMIQALLGAADGSRQLALSLSGLAPGLGGLTGWLAIGQRPVGAPWLAIGQAGGAKVLTAQMRLYLLASLAPGALAGLTGGAAITLPVYLEAASAEADLTAVDCTGDASSHGFDLVVTPSLGTLAIANLDTGSLADFTRAETLSPANLVNAPALKASAYSQANLGGGAAAAQAIHVTAADVAGHAAKTVSTGNLAAETTASLLASTSLQVQVAGLGPSLGPSGPSAALSMLLSPAASSLDNVIDQIEGLSGVRLGVASVWPEGLRCNGAALVG